MDFHTLTRKALQALCKQNGIPANITNVAMADSLSALQHVEGLEELLNQSPEKIMIGSANVSHTAARTTARRAPTKKTVGEEVGQEKTEVPPKTPAAPSTRRRAPAASASQKTEILAETASVQRAYSTRRSVRLLGKTMSNMSLGKDNTMASSIDELSADTMDCSEQSESSVGSDMQTVSENGVDASEVLSELKSNGQVIDESLVKDNKMDVTEVQKDGPMQESGMESELSAPKAASDTNMNSEVMNSEVMDESSEESSADDNEPHCEGAQDMVKDFDDVIAAQSALPQEVNEPPSAVKTVELISSTLSSTPTKSPASKVSDDVIAAQSALPQEVNEPPSAVKTDENISSTLSSTTTKSPASKVSDVNVAATTIEPKEVPKTEALGDYSGKFDFESGSSTEGDSEDEGAEDESVDEVSSELQDNMNDIKEASEEEDSDDETTEGESSDEEDSDDDLSEEEYSEDEAVADISKKQSAQKSLIVDSDDDITEEEFSEDESVADISEKQTSQKSLIVENADANMSEAAVVAKAESFSPLPVNIATQFPRPTSAKSSGKKRPESAMYISDDNDESLDKDEDLKEVEMKKKDEVIVGKEEIVEEFKATSLRQLKKLLKSKLKIEDSKDTKVVEKTRIALSQVPENQMNVKEN